MIIQKTQNEIIARRSKKYSLAEHSFSSSSIFGSGRWTKKTTKSVRDKAGQKRKRREEISSLFNVVLVALKKLLLIRNSTIFFHPSLFTWSLPSIFRVFHRKGEILKEINITVGEIKGKRRRRWQNSIFPFFKCRLRFNYTLYLRWKKVCWYWFESTGSLAAPTSIVSFNLL